MKCYTRDSRHEQADNRGQRICVHSLSKTPVYVQAPLSKSRPSFPSTASFPGNSSFPGNYGLSHRLLLVGVDPSTRHHHPTNKRSPFEWMDSYHFFLQGIGEELVQLGDAGRDAQVDGPVADLDDEAAIDGGIDLMIASRVSDAPTYCRGLLCGQDGVSGYVPCW